MNDFIGFIGISGTLLGFPCTLNQIINICIFTWLGLGGMTVLRYTSVFRNTDVFAVVWFLRLKKVCWPTIWWIAQGGGVRGQGLRPFYQSLLFDWMEGLGLSLKLENGIISIWTAATLVKKTPSQKTVSVSTLRKGFGAKFPCLNLKYQIKAWEQTSATYFNTD